MKNKGITLISLVITIIVLIILSSIAIYLSLGNNGIFIRAKEAREVTNKQEATDIINLKITTAQMNKYAEKQEMPTLKELSEVLKDDTEIAYVTEKSQIASTKYEVGENPSSIYTKLNNYPYEFEINSSLQLASIDGVKIATEQLNVIGNSIGENTVENYNYKNFNLNVGTSMNGLSGNSKFGTIDSEGNLTFNQAGLYSVYSSNIIIESGGQVYNRIYVNGIQLVFSIKEQGEIVGIPVTATFYANKGDKLKVEMKCHGTVSPIYSWNININKIF